MSECPACEGKGYYIEKEGRWTVAKTCISCNGTGEYLQSRSRLKLEEAELKFKAEPIEEKPPMRGRPRLTEKTRTTMKEPCTICEPPGSGKRNLYGYDVPDKRKWSLGRREKCMACDGSGEIQVTYIGEAQPNLKMVEPIPR